MKTYHLSQDFIRATVRRTWLISAPLSILLLLIVIIVTTSIILGNIDWQVFIPTVIFLLVVELVSIFLTNRSQQAIFRSVRIELDEDCISRSQLRIPPVRIARSEIAEIRTIRQGLCIQSVDKFRSLAIPTCLVDEDGLPADAEIRATLESWSPIKLTPASRNVRVILLSVALFAAMMVIYFVNQIWIVLPVWLALIGYTLYGLNQLRHYKGVDPRYRRNLILVYGFILLTTGLKICALTIMSVYLGFRS